MKIKSIIAVAAGLLLAGVSQAATVSGTNIGGDTSTVRPIVVSSGSSAATGGTVNMGYFNTLSASQIATLAATPTLANILTLANDFVSVVTTTIDGAGANTGLYNAATAGNITLPGARNNESFYTFIGNSGSLLTSTSFLLWDHVDTIGPVDTVATPDSNNLQLGTEGSALISGGTTNVTIPTDALGAPPGSTAQFTGVRLFNAIPEPSTALLGAIGALGLLRRRR